MTERIQTFLLKNTKFLQKFVNEKLANGPFIPNFWKWMEIGQRGYGKHIFSKYFKLYNSWILNFGTRMNYGRPHLQKQIFSKEREIFITGYAAMFVMVVLWTRKNKLRPLYEQNDPYLSRNDNSLNLTDLYGVLVAPYIHRYKKSAHYIEINRIFSTEMMKKFRIYFDEVKVEFEESSEKVKRTKYLTNQNYVYEPFGWELVKNN